MPGHPRADSAPPIEARLRSAGLSALPRTAWLEIDLDAVVANLAAVRTLVGPGVRIEPVVKADAYGHGMVPIARALQSAGADGLCVATLDEALALRAAGVGVPLVVLYPIPAGGALEAAGRRIEVAAGDEALLRDLLGTVAAAGRRGRHSLGIQLEVETGLGRGGFTGPGVVRAAMSVRDAPGTRLAGTWSHLAAAGDHARTADQVAQFEAAVETLARAGIDPGLRHLAASGGLLAGVPAFDAVRPGLVVYGIAPAGVRPTAAAARLAAALRPVMAVRARPVRVADLPAGHGVSYGPTFETSRPTRIATLPIGYGDGWSRAGSNRGEALVRGVRVPLVGTVAMDAVMADVTDVPGPPVTPADRFTLLGRDGRAEISADDVARSRTTIAWEVVTAMAGRMPRVYHAAAGPVELRTLAVREDRWRGSNSGTATSVSSRSTRS